jgi:hypothetical protein
LSSERQQNFQNLGDLDDSNLANVHQQFLANSPKGVQSQWQLDLQLPLLEQYVAKRLQEAVPMRSSLSPPARAKALG